MHGWSRAGGRGRASRRRSLGSGPWLLLALAACLAVLLGTGAALEHGQAQAAARAKRPSAHAARVALAQSTLIVPKGVGASPFNSPRKLAMPTGWHGEVWARVSGARFAAWSPQGQLLVSSASAGQVVVLAPGAGGAAGSQKVLISGLTAPQGLAFDTLEGVQYLYVAESNQLDRYVWGANGTLGARTVLIKGLPDESKAGDDVHHVKSIAVGSDHTIYVAVGSASNATPNEPGESPPRASILSFHADGTHMQVFASGVRNGEGLSFAPDGSLWTAVNERDEIPYPFHRPYGEFADAYGHVIPRYVDEHPPDEVARLTAGRDLGWPYCNPDPDTKPGDFKTGRRYLQMPFDADAQTNPGGSVLNCSTLAPIELGIPAHSAPLGFNFLQNSSITGHFANGAALAVHGSWNRTPPRPPAVLWAPWKKRTATLGKATTMIEGFQEPSGTRWGRAVDAVPGPDGSLYVTDDAAGAVYRLGPGVGQ
jgi:glucose/arabinose dehydrogenase